MITSSNLNLLANIKRSSILLGSSALTCVALSGIAHADDFVITSSNNSTNGNINPDDVDGSDTVSLGIALATMGRDVAGIKTSDNTNTVTVTETGSITTEGSKAHGIYNKGDSNTTAVSGSIDTTNFIAHGIYNEGASNITNISGSITTGGNNAHGIYNEGASNITNISGSITTGGSKAYGIYNDGASNITNIAGSITTTGDNAHGIYNDGDSNTTTLSGTIKATGAQSVALYISDGHRNSFTLNEGATIIGDILSTKDDQTTNSKLIFNLGASVSYAYSVSGQGAGTGEGQWTFSDLDGRTQGITEGGIGCATISDADNTVCNLVTAVGNGNAEAQDELQFGMNSAMIGSLSVGSNTGGSAEDTSVTQTSNNSWVNVYGGSSKRDASTTQSSFDTRDAGLTVGIPMAISDNINVDLVFNTSNTKLDIGASKDQKITGKSYNVGAVLRDLAPATDWAVDAFGFIGRNSYDTKRKVMNNQEATGSETVTASYSGMEVLVGVDAQYSQAVNETLNFTSGVNASLSNERISAYSESKYYSWDARTLSQVAGGVTAGLEYHKDAFTSFATLGLQRSSLNSGKTAGYINNGTAGSYTDTSGAATYRKATVGFSYAANEGMNITGAAGMSRASGGIKGSSLSLSANGEF